MALLGVLTFLAGACTAPEGGAPPPESTFDPFDARQRERFGTVTGTDGVSIFSLGEGRNRQNGGGIGGGIGVNAFIWQASLETINFIPLTSADPFGGLIITDWFQSVDAPGERTKIHVLMLDSALRADAVRVTVFRQVRSEEGDWLDAPVEESTARSIEDYILTRARELRMASAATS
jgi:hypothetical protein